MARFLCSVWFAVPTILLVITILILSMAMLSHHEAVDPGFELIGRVEGCNVYHQPGTYGGSAFAVCRR